MKYVHTLPCGKPVLFRGVATALVTPFKNGATDLDAFFRLVERQLDGGAAALVICGTTGESPTLSHDEKLALISQAAEISDGRVPVIAGVGTNDTAASCALSIEASFAGADAVMTVTPYYNKATESGLISHFYAIADASPVPVIVYNVPGRTSVRLTPPIYNALAHHDNIVAVKEASGDVSLAADILAANADTLAVYSGNDELTLPILSLGGKGVISVVSNLLPRDVALLCNDFFSGDIDSARRRQLYLHPLIRALFAQPNPIPVKTALSALGLCSPDLRLPLTQPDDDEPLLGVLREYLEYNPPI